MHFLTFRSPFPGVSILIVVFCICSMEQEGQEIGDQVGGRRDKQGEQGGETGQEGEVRSEEGETSEEEQGKKDGGHNRRREEEGE